MVVVVGGGRIELNRCCMSHPRNLYYASACKCQKRRFTLQVRHNEAGRWEEVGRGRFLKQNPLLLRCFCQVAARFSLFVPPPRRRPVPAHLGVVVCLLDLCRPPSAFVCRLEPEPDRNAVYYCAFDKYFEQGELKPSVAAFFCCFSSFLAQAGRKTRCENRHGRSGPAERLLTDTSGVRVDAKLPFHAGVQLFSPQYRTYLLRDINFYSLLHVSDFI